MPPDGVGRVDVLCPMGSTISAALMDAASPRLVQQFGDGLSGVDLAAAAERGIPVDNVSGSVPGSSELLRTLVLGRLTRHSSEVLDLVLVEFEGGATFAGLGVA